MPHTLPYLANCSILFPELPLLERPAAAASAGFDAIEYWWPFPVAVPTATDVDSFVRAVQDAGVRLVGLNVFAGDMPGGDRGLMSWPQRSGELADSLAVATDIGGRLGVRAFNALYGNRVDGARPAEQDELAVENLTRACRAAAELDAVVLLEPVSGAPRYPLLLADDVVAVMDRVEQASGVTNLRLLADLYHLAVNGDDVPAAIARHAGRVGHVQIADAPGRHEPGTGSLDLDGQLEQLQAAGYSGWVGLEYVPATTTEAGLGFLPRERRAGTPQRQETA